MDVSNWNFFVSQKYRTVHVKKNMKEMFSFLNIVKIVTKSDLKYAKYRNQLEIYQQIMSLKIT